MQRNVKKKVRCPRFGGPHEFGKWDKDAKIECSCEGEHNAAYSGCIVKRIKKKKIRIKIIEKIIFAEALKRVRNKAGRIQSNNSEQQT